jgi:sugar transferase (PEP-CTERM system associated)
VVEQEMDNRHSDSEQQGQLENENHARRNVRFFSHSTQVLRHHVPTEFILLGLVEVIALYLSFHAGVHLRFRGEVWSDVTQSSLTSSGIIYSLVMLFSLIAFGAYQRQAQKSNSLLAVRIAGSLFLGLVILSMTYYIAPMFFLGRGALALAVFVSFVSIMAVRLVFLRITQTYDMRIRVLVLGAGNAAALVKKEMKTGMLDGLNIISYMPMPGDARSNKAISLVNTPGALVKYVADMRIDVIVLAMDERRKGLPVHELLDCKMGGVQVIDLLTFFERFTNKIRLDIMQPSWLFLSEGFTVSNFRKTWKRIMDVACVLVLTPIVTPLALLSMIAIIIDSKGRGPIFYSQPRVGENGKIFRIYKFRSMVTDAEQDGVARWADKNDSRITRVGSLLRKSRFDEIPQLYNILKGDMSFVGPRPERPEFVDRLARNIPYYRERHRVKPGLTGWAQINYPYGASEEDGLEKLQFDLFYVKNYSILLDALVLLQTTEVVLLGRGAH